MSEETKRAILHVDMDAFYASVEQHDDPALAGLPVIVGGTGGRGVVAAASYEARAFGVRSAMPVSQARRLAPGAQFVRPRMDRYRAVSQKVFGIFRRFTPLVEGLSLDEAFLDVTGSLKIFGSREVIGEALRTQILAETGLHASVGMAHNKFLAKLASDLQKPQGFVSVDADDLRRFLDPMPVRRLWGIGKKTQIKLRAQGILTIAQLRLADPQVLRQVLGNRAGHYLALSRGEDDRPVKSKRPDKSISHETTFEQDILDERELRSVLLGLAEDVMRRVRHQQLCARTVTLKIRDRQFNTVTRSLTVGSPVTGTRTVYQMAAGMLQEWLRTHVSTPVRLLGVGVTGLEAQSPESMPVQSLDRAVDEITERFGSGKLKRGLTVSAAKQSAKK